MASKITLIVVTISLFCLSCNASIRGLDLTKHVVSANGSMPGMNGVPQTIISAGNSSGSIAGERIYIHYAGYQSKATLWHGVRAEIPRWEILAVQPYSSSGMHIAAISETNTGRELVAAGFHVSPNLYKDNNLHFYTYWASNAGNSSRGCYNDYCPGFVPAAGGSLYPGEVIGPPYSAYAGKQRGSPIRIKKDEITGDWSLYQEDPYGPTILLGWWPSSLFKSLSKNANIIQWAGIVMHKDGEMSPSMGSGHFSRELDGKAAVFAGCFGFDTLGDVYKADYIPIPIHDKPDCYTVSDWYVARHKARRHFFFGGPAGCSQ